MDRGHTIVGYMFGFLTIVDNIGTSLEAVQQALEALHKFSTPSIAGPMTRNWIRSVMVRWYEIKLISLAWGRQFWHAKELDLPHCPKPGCQVTVLENRREEDWMTSCNRTCCWWWRQEHMNIVRKFIDGFGRM
jgi:hypothetical protein